MSIFKSKNQHCDIFICLWEWCPTWCQSCPKTVQKTSFIPFSILKNQIDASHSLSDTWFWYFLYGTDNLKHPEIETILAYLRSLKRNYRVQINPNTPFSHLAHMRQTSGLHEFVISKKVSTQHELKEIFESFQTLHNHENIIINYDLLIDDTYIPFLEKILRCQFIKESENIHTSKIHNFYLNLRKLYTINYKNKSVENLHLKHCIIQASFQINENHIEIHDHYEIDKNLDICFHNPLCFLGNNKIANTSLHPSQEIITLFWKYRDYLGQFKDNFHTSCFACIHRGFDYRKEEIQDEPN